MSTLSLGRPARGPLASGALASPVFVLGGYVAAVAVAEAFGVLAGTLAGALAYALVLVVAVNHQALLRARGGAAESTANVVAAFGLVALLRVLSATLPVTHAEPGDSYMLVSVPVLAGVLVAQRVLGPAAVAAERRRGAWATTVVVAALVFGLAVVGWLILRPDGLVASHAPPGRVAYALDALIVAGMTEELLLRGQLQRHLVRAIGPSGLWWTAAVSGLIYAGAGSAAFVMVMTALALVLGFSLRRTGSVLVPAVAHALFNVLLLVVLPLWLG
jgi:membrane protease YdiL (CAAX protease family)